LWKQAEWDVGLGGLVMDWNMEKVARQKLMIFFNDQTDNWMMDFDVAMFEYFMSGRVSTNNGDEDEQWMFPFLALYSKPSNWSRAQWHYP
jgi:hypothetical protein